MWIGVLFFFFFLKTNFTWKEEIEDGFGGKIHTFVTELARAVHRLLLFCICAFYCNNVINVV